MNLQQNEEIKRLYLEMYSKLFDYAFSSLKNESLAEEAVQNTFQIACQKPEKVCNSPNPQGWLVITLKNVISNTVKSRETSTRILTEYYKLRVREIQESTDPEALDILYHDLTNMEEYQLVKGMAIDGKSYLELAKERNISVEACRKRMQRAREFLQGKIKK